MFYLQTLVFDAGKEVHMEKVSMRTAGKGRGGLKGKEGKRRLGEKYGVCVSEAGSTWKGKEEHLHSIS